MANHKDDQTRYFGSIGWADLVYGIGLASPRGIIQRHMQTYNMSEADIAERDRLARENTRQVRRQKERLAKKGRA
jgi:hypothetical protein